MIGLQVTRRLSILRGRAGAKRPVVSVARRYYPMQRKTPSNAGMARVGLVPRRGGQRAPLWLALLGGDGLPDRGLQPA